MLTKFSLYDKLIHVKFSVYPKEDYIMNLNLLFELNKLCRNRTEKHIISEDEPK